MADVLAVARARVVTGRPYCRTDLDALPRPPPGPGETRLPTLGCVDHPQDGCTVVYQGDGLLRLYCHQCLALVAHIVVGTTADLVDLCDAASP